MSEIQHSRIEPPDRDKGQGHPRHNGQRNGEPNRKGQSVAEPRSTLAELPRAECLGDEWVKTQQQPDPDDRQREKECAANTNGPYRLGAEPTDHADVDDLHSHPPDLCHDDRHRERQHRAELSRYR